MQSELIGLRFGTICRSLIEKPIILYGDNDVATQTSQERRTQPRSRHWLLKFHALREHIKKGFVTTKRVPTAINVSDGYTKSMATGDWKNIGMKPKGYGPIYTYETKTHDDALNVSPQ